jgi:putative chitinase
MATQLRKELTDFLRPKLGGILTQDVVNWLDAWSDRAGVPRDGTPAIDAKPVLPASPSPVPAAGPAPADDRYLAVFRQMADPAAKPDAVQAMARSFAQHAPTYGQDKTKPRIAEFVAQIANETGGFKRFDEDLRYRAATMLRQWPSHFTPAQAAAAVGNPVEIASRAYGGRMGNAPYPSHDGYTFRGRGALQLTGRAAYRLYGDLTGLPLEQKPDLAAEPADSILIALAFFKERDVNGAIDANDFRKARRLTNGGVIGLENVAKLRARVLALL